MGNQAAEKILSDTFKSIVMPLKKLVDISNPSIKIEVKQNDSVMKKKKKDKEEDE